MAEVNLDTALNKVGNCALNWVKAPGKTVEGIGELLQGDFSSGIEKIDTGLCDLLYLGIPSEIKASEQKEGLEKVGKEMLEEVSKELLKPKYYNRNCVFKHEHSNVKNIEIKTPSNDNTFVGPSSTQPSVELSD